MPIGFGLWLAQLKGGSGTVVVPLLDGFTPSGAYSTTRTLLSTYSGDLYTAGTGSAIASLNDQSGNARNFANAGATQPTITTLNSQSWLNFNGTQNLTGPLISAAFGATSTWMAIVCYSTLVDIDRTGSSDPKGNALMGDTAEGGNVVYGTNVAATTSQWGHGPAAVQYDGAYHYVNGTFHPEGNPAVIQFRKDATNLYIRVNLNTENSVAMNAFTAIAYNLLLGGGSGGNNWFKGNVAEVVIFADANVPTSTQRDAIVTDMMNTYNSPSVPDISGYPSAATTGTTGSLITVTGDVTLSTDGATYSGNNVTGLITVSANNVTIDNCKVTNGGFWAIRVLDGYTNPRITNCEIDCLGTGNTTGIALGSGGGGLVDKCNIYNMENGVVLYGNGHTVSNCYMHDFASLNDSGHYDGVEMNGLNNNCAIVNNTIINQKDQTSCVQMNNFSGASDSLIVSSNYLSGGAYPVYSDANQGAGTMTNISILNNIFAHGVFGWIAINSNTPTHTGNRDITTGFIVDSII